jgi:hypothetical protein
MNLIQRNRIASMLQRCLVTLAILWINCALTFCSFGQESQPPSSDRDELADELLKDLIPNDAANSADSATPNDADPAGQRSFGSSENPLEVIHMGMLTASKYLREGETGTNTQEVQNNVLLRLDELIDMSQKQAKKPRSSSSRTSSQRSTKRSAPQEQKPQQRSDSSQQRSGEKNRSQGEQENNEESGEGAEKNNRENQENENGDQSDVDPNSTGRQASNASRSGKAALGDAKALQQGVWGHLPERIRQQMMSRMVERFLPEYEASIEEYFRKLSDSEEETEQP